MIFKKSAIHTEWHLFIEVKMLFHEGTPRSYHNNNPTDHWSYNTADSRKGHFQVVEATYHSHKRNQPLLHG